MYYRIEGASKDLAFFSEEFIQGYAKLAAQSPAVMAASTQDFPTMVRLLKKKYGEAQIFIDVLCLGMARFIAETSAPFVLRAHRLRHDQRPRRKRTRPRVCFPVAECQIDMSLSQLQRDVSLQVFSQCFS